MADPRFPGVEPRHARTCPAHGWQRCGCKPSYRGVVWSKTDGRKLTSPAFHSPHAAARWRQDAQVDLRRGVLRAPKPTTIRQHGDKLLEGMEDGTIRNRSRRQYKPSVIRSYRQALQDHIYPDLGAVKLSELDVDDVQALVERLLADGRRAPSKSSSASFEDSTPSPRGLSPSTVRNAIMPLRVICRRAHRQLPQDPLRGLELPAVDSHRDRYATPEEAQGLIVVLPADEGDIWATAMYGGLRRGELMGVREMDFDLADGVVRVEQAYDPVARKFIEPKSYAGRRKVPIAAVLRDRLVAHRMRHPDRPPAALAFGRRDGLPFWDTTLANRARRAWKSHGHKPIGLHECQHTFAALMIAAGVNAKALQTFMGHQSITVTYDRYGHLMPGSETEAAALLDSYLLKRAQEQARSADVEEPASDAPVEA